MKKARNHSISATTLRRGHFHQWLAWSSLGLFSAAPAEATLINLIEDGEFDAIPLPPGINIHRPHPQAVGTINVAGAGSFDAPLRDKQGRYTGNFLYLGTDDQDPTVFLIDVPAGATPGGEVFEAETLGDESDWRITRGNQFFDSGSLVRGPGEVAWEPKPDSSIAVLGANQTYRLSLYCGACLCRLLNGIDQLRFFSDVPGLLRNAPIGGSGLFAIPEPRTAGLALTGLALLAAHRRKRKAKRSR